VAAGVESFRSIAAVRFLPQLAIAFAAFGAGVGLAELFGAASLGVAFGFGQIAFAIACVVLLLRA
jgi:hypothetical protein